MSTDPEVDTSWCDIADWLTWWLKKPRLSSGSQQVFDRYYASYKRRFTPYLRRHYTSQIREANCLVGKGMRVLEVGCGCGTEALWFAMQGASVVGIDLKEPRLDVARERADYIRGVVGVDVDADFVNSSLFDLDQEAKFDLVWMEMAFHHLEPRAELPSVFARLLRPGGHVVIAEANGLNPLLQVGFFKHRGWRTISEHIDKDGRTHLYGVERITTARRIKKLFSGQGFTPVSSRYFRVFPNLLFVEHLAWIEQWVPSWLLPAFTHYVVVLKKNSNE